MRLHASCVDYRGRGVLLMGPPQSGKSTLALAMIEAGARLVADDQVVLRVESNRLLASAPVAARGIIELSGFGIVRLTDYVVETPVAFMFELRSERTERWPGPPVVVRLLEQAVPSLPVWAGDPHSGRKAIAWLSAWDEDRTIERLPVASAVKSA